MTENCLLIENNEEFIEHIIQDHLADVFMCFEFDSRTLTSWLFNSLSICYLHHFPKGSY